MSVSIVARRHDINANVVFGWRKQYREGKLELPRLAPSAMTGTELRSVDVIDSMSMLPAPQPTENTTSKVISGVLAPIPVCEIEVEVGKRLVRIRGLSVERAEAFLQECLK
ncbi:transposase [Burkholderia lata]